MSSDDRNQSSIPLPAPARVNRNGGSSRVPGISNTSNDDILSLSITPMENSQSRVSNASNSPRMTGAENYRPQNSSVANSVTSAPLDNPFQTPSDSNFSSSASSSLMPPRQLPSKISNIKRSPSRRSLETQLGVKSMDAVPRYDAEEEIRKEGKAKVRKHKKYLVAFIVLLK
jgi:hypothetical protein